MAQAFDMIDADNMRESLLFQWAKRLHVCTSLRDVIYHLLITFAFFSPENDPTLLCRKDQPR